MTNKKTEGFITEMTHTLERMSPGEKFLDERGRKFLARWSVELRLLLAEREEEMRREEFYLGLESGFNDGWGRACLIHNVQSDARRRRVENDKNFKSLQTNHDD